MSLEHLVRAFASRLSAHIPCVTKASMWETMSATSSGALADWLQGVLQ
jgi:hypothetical protein